MIRKGNQKTQIKKGRKYNVQATKGQTDKRTNNDLQNNTPQAKDEAMLIPLENGSDLHVLHNGKKFLFHMLYPSCYSCDKSCHKTWKKKRTGLCWDNWYSVMNVLHLSLSIYSCTCTQGSAVCGLWLHIQFTLDKISLVIYEATRSHW
jgi:hypothetical protein